MFSFNRLHVPPMAASHGSCGRHRKSMVNYQDMETTIPISPQIETAIGTHQLVQGEVREHRFGRVFGEQAAAVDGALGQRRHRVGISPADGRTDREVHEQGPLPPGAALDAPLPAIQTTVGASA